MLEIRLPAAIEDDGRSTPVHPGAPQTAVRGVPARRVLAKGVVDEFLRYPAFDRCGLSFDPYEVLRGVRAEGSNRVLYRLDAEISWLHPK